MPLLSKAKPKPPQPNAFRVQRSIRNPLELVAVRTLLAEQYPGAITPKKDRFQEKGGVDPVLTILSGKAGQLLLREARERDDCPVRHQSVRQVVEKLQEDAAHHPSSKYKRTISAHKLRVYKPSLPNAAPVVSLFENEGDGVEDIIRDRQFVVSALFGSNDVPKQPAWNLDIPLAFVFDSSLADVLQVSRAVPSRSLILGPLVIEPCFEPPLSA